MLGLVKPISVGICGDARRRRARWSRVCKGKSLACSANQRRASRRRRSDEKRAWEAELDGWTHEKDRVVASK